MQRACEVCTGLEKIGCAPEDHPRRRIRRVLIGERIVTLCDRHADEVRRSGQSDVESLCRMYQEPGGKRSLMDRRAPLDRRVFPPRPEGRRRGGGRRHDDARE